jgi:hypothetical protein
MTDKLGDFYRKVIMSITMSSDLLSLLVSGLIFILPLWYFGKRGNYTISLYLLTIILFIVGGLLLDALFLGIKRRKSLAVYYFLIWLLLFGLRILFNPSNTLGYILFAI